MAPAVFNLDHPAHYVNWHFFHMSVANIVVIVLMIVVFVAAILCRSRPEGVSRERRAGVRGCGPNGSASGRSARCRRRSCSPTASPAYVSSWIYVFGVATIAALIVVVVSGVVLGLKGPAWWHVSSVGQFFNSIHLWAVEIFFFVMVIHLWGKFFMGAWRGGRAPHLGHRGGHLPGRDRRRLHRLSLAAELRLAVDRERGQGRAELGRNRRLLQRHRLRPDVHLPRHPAAGRRRGAGRLARPAGPPSRGRAPVSCEGLARSKADAPEPATPGERSAA